MHTSIFPATERKISSERKIPEKRNNIVLVFYNSQFYIFLLLISYFDFPLVVLEAMQ